MFFAKNMKSEKGENLVVVLGQNGIDVSEDENGGDRVDGGEVDVLGELHEAALGLGQEVELRLVQGQVPGEALDLVAEHLYLPVLVSDLPVLVGHGQVPLEAGLGLPVL